MADEDQIRELIRKLREDGKPAGEPYSQYIRKEDWDDDEEEFRKELERRHPGSWEDMPYRKGREPDGPHIEKMPYRSGQKSDGPYLKKMPHRKGSGKGGPYIKEL